MKTHLPTKLRAALLAAIFACSATTVDAVTYDKNTTLDGAAISESITVSPGVTVTLTGTSNVSSPSMSLGAGSSVINEGYAYIYEALSVSGTGKIINYEMLSIEGGLQVTNSTLVNNINTWVNAFGEINLENASISNQGAIYFEKTLTANNSIIDNKEGMLTIAGSADVVNSRLVNAGEIIFEVSRNSRVGKALLTIDAATVQKSGFSALPTTGITVGVATNDLASLRGNEYKFIEIDGFGNYGVSVVYTNEYVQEGTSNVYRNSDCSAYYFTMDKLMSGNSVIGIKFGTDAAFIEYVYVGNDFSHEVAHGNIVYTMGEELENLHVGSDANITLKPGAELTVNSLSINGGSLTIDGGTLHFAEEAELNGPVQILLNSNTKAGSAIITGLKEGDINVQINTALAGSLSGKTYQFVEGIALGENCFSATSGTIDWEAGIIGTAQDGQFQLTFTQDGDKMTFAYGSAISNGGNVDSDDFVVETPTLTPDSYVTLEQTIVTGETATGTVTEGGTTTNVLSSNFADAAVNVVYAQNVTGDSSSIQTATLSSTLKEGQTTIAQSSDSLVLNFTADTDLAGGELGCGEEASGKQVTIQTAAGNTEVQIITSVDIIKNDGHKVTLSGMDVKADRALEMNGGEIILKGTSMTLGGKALTEEEYKQLHVTDGQNEQTISIETGKTAELALDMHTNTKVDGGKLTLDGTDGTDTSFKASYMKDDAGNLDKSAETSVEFHSAEVQLKDSDRGMGHKHFVAFGGSQDQHQTIHMYDSHLHGTGHVHNVHLHGGHFGIGNSPGIMTITDTEFNGTEWTFHMITDKNWVTDGANEVAGDAFSQLRLDGSNTVEGITIKINYQSENNGGYTNVDKADFTTKFESGASITLIDTANGSITGSYTFAKDTLPELANGLMWDTSRLFETGAIYVIYELTGDPGRIANTLVSAADTTGSFGRLALSQLNAPRAKSTNVWAQAFAACLDSNTVNGRSGFDSNTTGFAVGADYATRKMPFIIGATLGATNGTIKPNRGSASYTAGKIDQDGTQLGVYGRYTSKSDPYASSYLTIDGYITYGAYENDSSRNSYSTGKTASASWDENAWAMGVAITRNYMISDHAFVSPYVSLDYTTADMDNFVERQQSEAAYGVSDSYRNLALSLGVNAHRVFSLENGQKITPYANIALSQDILRQDAEVTATTAAGTIADTSAHQGRTAIQFGAGANWQISEKWNMNAGYSVEAREDAVDQRANIGASYSF